MARLLLHWRARRAQKQHPFFASILGWSNTLYQSDADLLLRAGRHHQYCTAYIGSRVERRRCPDGFLTRGGPRCPTAGRLNNLGRRLPALRHSSGPARKDARTGDEAELIGTILGCSNSFRRQGVQRLNSFPQRDGDRHAVKSSAPQTSMRNH